MDNRYGVELAGRERLVDGFRIYGFAPFKLEKFGVFAAAAKLSSLLIALAGGGSSTLPPDIAKEESGLGNHMFFLGLNHRF